MMPQLLSLLQKIFIPTIFILANTPAKAQITPDTTLSAEASTITPNTLINGANADLINGGGQRGGNLFHSFTEFNIGDGQRVYFDNPTGIQNILTRVTGGNQSNILGTLGVNGNANLFLINPNGIVFGQNASLDVRGSFVGTTANAVQFENQGIFSATNPQAPPLLTVNPSALLFNQINQNAGIQSNSVAPAGIDPAGFDAFGLRVGDGKSLLLVGGNVSIDAGELNAFGGRVELGGLAEPGNVNLLFDEDNLSLEFPENVARADVSLTNQTLVFVQAAGGGDIAINARNLEISGSSGLFAGIGVNLGTPETVAGDIILNATGDIKVVDSGSRIFNLVRRGANGNGGDITIDAGFFSLTDGAKLSAATLGQGNAGNITLRTKDAVSLANSAYILSTVEAGGEGKGGNIDINAATLSITEAAQILSVTLSAFDNQPAGKGDAGNVNVKVTGTVDIAGTKNSFFSGIFSAVDTGTVGNGGNIIIDAGSFSLRDGGQLAASTFGEGNAGNVTLRTKDTVSLVDSSILSTVEAGSVGKGGNIDINAATLSLSEGSQLITITRGVFEGQPAGKGDAGNVNVKVAGAVDIAGEKNTFASGIFSAVDRGTVGNGGNIVINSGSFSLRDGGQLVASTLGQGNAGTIELNAADFATISGKSSNFNSGLYVNSESTTGTAGDMIVNSPKITLDNQGTLKAESLSGNGGSINVNSDLLLLRRGSQISTNAGTQQQGGDGGNININSTFIVAAPNENSDITANAFSGAGGNINILTESIFGIEARPKPSELTNDITASSELGVQGQIAITQPEVQPTQGLIELPTEVVDASRQIAQICPRSPNAKPLGKFILTGRGSLPPSPLELMTGTSVQIPLATLEEQIATPTDAKITLVNNNPNSEIIEAQGLIKTADGQIALVAHAPKATPSSRPTAAVCPVASGLSH
jgi:filamentous hemagglutinin family protein